MTQTFVRNFEIETLNVVLEIQQKTVGDVSCVIWDAAIVLSKYLEILCKCDKNYLKNKQVIELGAGLGCAGLVASCFGAHVIMTDLPEVLDNLNNNIEHNKAVWKSLGGSASAKALKWGSSDVEGFSPPDLLIAADCVYYEEISESSYESKVELLNACIELMIMNSHSEVPSAKLSDDAWKKPAYQDLFGYLKYIPRIWCDPTSNKESVEFLIKSMVALCGDETEIIVCQEERDTEKQLLAWRLFMELFNKHFDYTKVPLKDQHTLYSCDEIVILQGKKRA